MEYQTPFALRTPEARTTPPLAPQVVLVLVDGLAYHASRAMPFLNELRARGADYDCRLGLPSLSLPGRAVLMSGAWQEIHGQATNFNARPLPVEHLFLTARRRGLVTALAAGSDPQTLFAPYVMERVVYPRVPKDESARLDRLHAELLWMGEETRGLLREKRPNLFVMDYTIADEAGHGWGAGSEEYREAAGLVDQEIRKVAAEMDLGRAVLVVTSDHGHTHAGGHGGPEDDVLRVPVVMAGGPVRAGVQGQCEQVDVAPTLAAILGIAVPASNQGRPLLDALTVSAADRQQVVQALVEQRGRFVAHYVERVNGATAAGGATARGEAALPDLSRRAEEAKRQRSETDGRRRAWVLLACVSALAAAAVLLRAGSFLPPGGYALALLAGLASAAAYFALFRAVGLQYSFSAVNRDEALGRFFLTDMGLAVSACAVATAAAAAWLSRRAGALRYAELARLAFLTTAVFCALLLVKMALAYWRHGIFLRWQMPDQFWAFGFYLDTLAVVALGFSAPLMPLAAWSGAWVAAKVTGASRPR